MADFTSDNCAPAHPLILEALLACSRDTQPSYGQDMYSARLQKHFEEWFECPVAYALVATGTAANSLALSLYTPSYGAIYCHKHAHILADEYGAPGWFSGGAQILGIEGEHGRIAPDAFAAALEEAKEKTIFPSVLSVTQATESGTLYTPDGITELCDIAHASGMKTHMDGARFCMALAASSHSPAQMTWRSGIDALSLGGTKNGCFAAEAVILFHPDAGAEKALRLKQKQSGQLMSKQRYLAAQFLAYLDHDLWQEEAKRALKMAKELANMAIQCGIAPLYPVEANAVFLQLPPVTAAALAQNHTFFRWHDGSFRFVTSGATQAQEVEAFGHSLRNALKLL